MNIEQIKQLKERGFNVTLVGKNMYLIANGMVEVTFNTLSQVWGGVRKRLVLPNKGFDHLLSFLDREQMKHSEDSLERQVALALRKSTGVACDINVKLAIGKLLLAMQRGEDLSEYACDDIDRPNKKYLMTEAKFFTDYYVEVCVEDGVYDVRVYVEDYYLTGVGSAAVDVLAIEQLIENDRLDRV